MTYTIVEVCELFPDTDRTIRFHIAKLENGQFRVWGEFLADHSLLEKARLFKSERDAWLHYQRLMESVATNPLPNRSAS